jgi:hypothetical protein
LAIVIAMLWSAGSRAGAILEGRRVRLTGRYFISLGNVFFSLILGAVAMGFFWYYFPDEFVQLQRGAAQVREWIAGQAWSNRAETILRFLLEDRQLLLMGFVIVVRILTGLVIMLMFKIFGYRAEPHF